MAQEFEDGDIFYTEKNKLYTPYKILKKRTFGDDIVVLNVRAYESLDHVPAADELQGLSTMVGVTPIDAKGFPSAVKLSHAPISEEEERNYLEYLMLSSQFQEYAQEKARGKGISDEALFQEALSYYNSGNEKLEQKDLEGAIYDYSLAVDLCPLLYEAFDNRGLAYLDSGDMGLARADFIMSLKINPNGELAAAKYQWIEQVKHNEGTVEPPHTPGTAKRLKRRERDTLKNSKEMLKNSQEILKNSNEIPVSPKGILKNSKEIPVSPKGILKNSKEIQMSPKGILKNSKVE